MKIKSEYLITPIVMSVGLYLIYLFNKEDKSSNLDAFQFKPGMTETQRKTMESLYKIFKDASHQDSASRDIAKRIKSGRYEFNQAKGTIKVRYTDNYDNSTTFSNGIGK